MSDNSLNERLDRFAALAQAAQEKTKQVLEGLKASARIGGPNEYRQYDLLLALAEELEASNVFFVEFGLEAMAEARKAQQRCEKLEAHLRALDSLLG